MDQVKASRWARIGAALMLVAASCLSALSNATPASADAANNSADFVFGQSGSYSTATTGSGAGQLKNPNGTATDSVRHRMYVADKNNNRILVYNLNTDNSIPDDTADYSLGSTSPSVAGGAGASQTSFNGPSAVAYDPSTSYLYVADSSNSRIMVFDASAIANNMNALYELGQTGFTTTNQTIGQSSLGNPYGLAIDSVRKRLYVADNYNRRVMVFDTTSLTNNMNAIYVLGQTSFSNSSGGGGQSTMTDPKAVAVDPNGFVYVVDKFLSRVQIFDGTNLSNGMNASYVLGQTSFTNGGSATTSAGLNGPWGITIGSGYIFVADTGNSRVMAFPLASLATGEAATMVFGQPDFVTGTSGVSQTKMNAPSGVGVDANGHLFVGDTTNHRVLMFNIFKQSMSSNVYVQIDPTLTFGVANNSAACNSESNFASAAGTAASISFGHLIASNNVSGGQSLSVVSNAGGGFAVYVRGTQASQNLRSGSYNWTDVSGTYASPAALSVAEGFGYTYKDSTTSSSIANPGSALFSALDNTNRAVMGSASSTSGSGCVSFDAKTSATTPAGSYSATVIYTAVPVY